MKARDERDYALRDDRRARAMLHRLVALLRDPQPGLFTWTEMLAKRLTEAEALLREDNFPDCWRLDTYPAPRGPETWAELLTQYGPLTDATDPLEGQG